MSAMEGIRKEVFGNGLVLITEPMRNLRSVALGVWMKRGSRHETPDQNGISHFIEHLLFKGTETRSAQDIALIVDSVGGQMDAFTTKEYTCFYFKVLDEHLDIAVDLLSDMLAQVQSLRRLWTAIQPRARKKSPSRQLYIRAFPSVGTLWPRPWQGKVRGPKSYPMSFLLKSV